MERGHGSYYAGQKSVAPDYFQKITMLLVHHLLEESAKKYPYKIGLVYRGMRVSYHEINEKANQLAHSFLQLGIRRGDKVGIYLEKSIENVITIFAISKIGAPFVIINPFLKDDGVSHIIRDCSIKGIISSGDKLLNSKKALKSKSLKFVMLVGDGNKFNLWQKKPINFETICKEKKNNLKIKVKKSDLATIIYTSGSTGMPKGVMLTHENVVLSALSGIAHLGINRKDVILSLLPFSFDYGLTQIMTCFKAGGTLVLKKYLFSEEVLETIIKEKITGLSAIPAIWIRLLQARNIMNYRFTCLRYITNSGDRLPVKYVRQLRKIFPYSKLFLMYGFTEAFRSTYLDPSQVDKRPDSIGKAIPNAEVFVINEEGKECRPGEVGELIQRGPLVSKGYWGKPQETAEKIKQNPFVRDRKDLVCYSGDFVKRDREGYHYFIGRKNAIIKSLGYRISPTEIETQLYKNHEVKEAVVFGVPDELMGEKIKAIVTLKKKKSLTGKDIIRFCTKYLPGYMTPKIVTIIDKMPLTAHGKIDRPLLKKRYGN